jgi:hypothetical protein
VNLMDGRKRQQTARRLRITSTGAVGLDRYQLWDQLRAQRG